MCAAIQEMVADGKLEGKREGEIKGAIETCQKFNVSLQDTIQHIADTFSLSLQQAEDEVKKYWK